MKSPKAARNKEDYLAPTKIKQDNTPDKVKAEKYLSDKELQDRLDLYSKGSKEQSFKVQKIKNKYLGQIRDEQAKRSKADVYYAQGIRIGLPHTDYQNIKDARDQADQNFRDQIAKEGKTQYKRHQNLSRLFSKNNSKEKQVSQSGNSKQQKKIKPYKKIGNLMAEYNAVQTAKNKVISQIKHIEAGPANSPSDAKFREIVKPDQKTLS